MAYTRMSDYGSNVCVYVHVHVFCTLIEAHLTQVVGRRVQHPWLGKELDARRCTVKKITEHTLFVSC